jgi:hypothetical protein
MAKETVKIDSVTYLTDGPNPAKCPVYYMDYEDSRGIKRTRVLKFRYNGVRGVFVTNELAVQEYLDAHPHLTKEKKLTRHITASLTHSSVPKENPQRTGVLTAMERGATVAETK